MKYGLISRLLAIYDKMCVEMWKYAKNIVVICCGFVNLQNNNLQNITLNDTIIIRHVSKIATTNRWYMLWGTYIIRFARSSGRMIWIFVNQKVENQLTHILAGSLGQFTRNYTQTTKRGLLTTNKGWISSTGEVRDIQPVLLSGVSKGAYPLAHDFACKV